MTRPASANDPAAKKALQVELKQKVKLGKRKSREFQESGSEEVGMAARGRSSTLVSEFFNASPTTVANVHQSVEKSIYDDYGEDEDDDYVVPSAPKKSRWMAKRGGGSVGGRSFRR